MTVVILLITESPWIGNCCLEMPWFREPILISSSSCLMLFLKHHPDGKQGSERLLCLTQGTNLATDYALCLHAMAVFCWWNEVTLYTLLWEGWEDVQVCTPSRRMSSAKPLSNWSICWGEVYKSILTHMTSRGFPSIVMLQQLLEEEQRRKQTISRYPSGFDICCPGSLTDCVMPSFIFHF